jgi:sortase A
MKQAQVQQPQRRPRRRFVRALEYLCWFAAALSLAYLVHARLDVLRFRQVEAQHLETRPFSQRNLKPGEPLGEILVPRVGVSSAIAEGIDSSTLRHAVGHFPETPLPEQTGTVVLAGHRDTFFRGLRRIRANDLILLRTRRGEFSYRVTRTAVVGPEHTELLHSSPDSDLTLITCFPFRYVGPAPDRFVVQAQHVDGKSRAEASTWAQPN